MSAAEALKRCLDGGDASDQPLKKQRLGDSPAAPKPQDASQSDPIFDEAVHAMMELLAAAAENRASTNIIPSEEEEFLQDLLPQGHAASSDKDDDSEGQKVLEKDARQHCPVKGCSQFYVRYRNLEQHIVSAHGVEHLKALEGPMEIDDSPKPFLCPAPGCGSRYVRKGDLKVHFLKKHKTLEGSFPDLLRSKSTKSGKKHGCPISECNCGYMRYGDLKSHFHSHHKDRLRDFPELAADNETPSVCRVPNCTIRCTTEAALDTHMRLFHPEIETPALTPNSSNQPAQPTPTSATVSASSAASSTTASKPLTPMSFPVSMNIPNAAMMAAVNSKGLMPQFAPNGLSALIHPQGPQHFPFIASYGNPSASAFPNPMSSRGPSLGPTMSPMTSTMSPMSPMNPTMSSLGPMSSLPSLGQVVPQSMQGFKQFPPLPSLSPSLSYGPAMPLLKPMGAELSWLPPMGFETAPSSSAFSSFSANSAPIAGLPQTDLSKPSQDTLTREMN